MIMDELMWIVVSACVWWFRITPLEGKGAWLCLAWGCGTCRIGVSGGTVSPSASDAGYSSGGQGWIRRGISLSPYTS